MLEKRYCPEEQEARWQKAWEEHGTFRYRPDARKRPFSIDTPPPTVSGSLHIGHIFSYTQAEMVARHRRMTGHAVYYPFGFDDNGLPTERLIERESNQDTRSMPREAILELGKPIVARHETAFKHLWQSLGFSCDWDLAYRTMSAEVQKLSQAAFLDLVKRDLAYTAEQPTLWCPHCRTSLAQADLDTKTSDTLFNTLRFRLPDEPGCPARFLPVATTRPEMLWGCVALFIHPDHPACAGYIGGEAIVPLYGHKVPILANREADPEKGTGIVMCCTFGDAADAQWVRTYSLPYRKVLEPDGTLSSEIPEIGGLPVRRARAAIIGLLQDKGILVQTEELTHQVGVHERCGTETELLPSRQWYIRLLENKERFLEAADQIVWHPASMKARYLDWVSGLKWDWCVSRQRRFGIPIPIWYCRSCSRPMLPDGGMLPLNPVERSPDEPCPGCGGTVFDPETGVLDTWATSSMTPQINAARRTALDREAGRFDSPDFLPMTMRTQAHEIIRTWAFYTIARSLYANGTLPWKEIMICGYVMADKGEKISKSKHNAGVDPLTLIRTHSADAVRYWAAGAKLGTDTSFRTDELDLSRRMMTKLWNASRFCSIHLDTLTEPDKHTASLQAADLWITARFNETLEAVSHSFDVYEAGDARRHLDTFFWHDFCDDWLELAKDRLYNPGTRGEAASAGAKVTLHRLLEGILKAYAPFMPHLTETIWQSIYTNPAMPFQSLHDTDWTSLPLPAHSVAPATLLAFGKILQTGLSDARRQKTQGGLSMKESIPLLKLTYTGTTGDAQEEKQILALLELALPDLQACTRALEIKLPEHVSQLIPGRTGKNGTVPEK